MRRLALASLALAIACSPSTRPTTVTVSRHALYVTHSAGFRHDVIPLSVQILQEIGPRLGGFDVTHTEDAATMTRDALARYDAVVFFTTGELPLSAEQKTAFLDFIRGGKGFIGIHSATDTFYEWPEYGRLIGAYFDGHPWHQRVTVRVEDRQHPASSQWPASFTIDDEIYQFRSWSRADVHVLLNLDPSSVDLAAPGVNRADRDFALAWTRTEGRGRVFYTALGHEAATWRDARVQQHLAGGIRWAMGDQ